MTNEELIDRLQHFACSKELYGYDAHALAELVTEAVGGRADRKRDVLAKPKHRPIRKIGGTQ